jgi:hypothetical protein
VLSVFSWRVCAAISGCAILAAVTHANVQAGPGYGSAQGWLMLAVAAGVGVSAFVTGRMWGSNRRWLAVGLVLAVAAGEAFTLVGTAERLIAAREATQAPLKAQASAVEKAATRLATAEAAKRTADAAVRSEAAKPGCKAHCAAMLGQAATDAQAEMVAARTALAGVAMPASSAPLADRLGIAPWAFDLMHAGFGSAAANALAFLLLAAGGHGHAPMPKGGPQRRRSASRTAKPVPEVETVQPGSSPVAEPPRRQRKPRTRVAKPRLGSSPLRRPTLH